MRPGWATPRRRTAPEGDLEVFGADEQNDVRVDVERWTALARSVLVAQGVHGDVVRHRIVQDIVNAYESAAGDGAGSR